MNKNLHQNDTGPSLGGWRPTYLEKSKNMREFRNVWGGVLNGWAGVGGWGSGWRGFLFPVKNWMTSSDSTEEENTSSSSKNWIGWCWNNWRKGKRGPWVCATARHQRDSLSTSLLHFCNFHTTLFLTLLFNIFSSFSYFPLEVLHPLDPHCISSWLRVGQRSG